jgi:hypothetical protein
MAVDALMFGAVDTVAQFNKLSTVFLPSQMATAVKFGFIPTVYDAEALGLGLAGGNGTSNAFATNFGSLDVSAFAQAASIAVFGNANLTGQIAAFASNWIAFYTANPAAHPGLSVTLASYGAAFGDTVGLALDNPTTIGAKVFANVSNALILNAEGLILVGTALDKQPVHKPLQGETVPQASSTSVFANPVTDTSDLVGISMTSLASHSGFLA